MDTEVCAAVGGQSVCPCTQPGLSGGWPSGGHGRGRCGRAVGRSGSTGRGRWAAGSGRAGAASRRSRRAGGPAHSLGGRVFGAEARRPLALCWLQLSYFGKRHASSPGPAPTARDGPQLLSWPRRPSAAVEGTRQLFPRAAGAAPRHSCRCVSASPVILGRGAGGGLHRQADVAVPSAASPW